MSSSAQVVDGEASESDSDIEIGKSPNENSPSSTKGFIIPGEAPESDDESKISSPKPVYREPVTPPPKAAPSSNLTNSLLHQKLWEANVSFRANLEGLVKHSIDISVEKLTRSDRMLLTVQESMRATNANLTLARARLKQLRDELEKANCSTALATVKVKSN